MSAKLDKFDRALIAKDAELELVWAKNQELRAELTTLRASLAEYQGAMRAQDQREDAAGVRCGVLRGYSGCDWPDAVAEEVLTLRASLEQARKELADCKLAYGKLFNENAAMMGRLDELGDL